MSQGKCRTDCHHGGNPRAAAPIWQCDRHNSPYDTAEANTQLGRPTRISPGESNAIFLKCVGRDAGHKAAQDRIFALSETGLVTSSRLAFCNHEKRRQLSAKPQRGVHNNAGNLSKYAYVHVLSTSSYLSGTLRRSRRRSFSTKITSFYACRISVASTGMNTTARLPSESRLEFDPLYSSKRSHRAGLRHIRSG